MAWASFYWTCFCICVLVSLAIPLVTSPNSRLFPRPSGRLKALSMNSGLVEARMRATPFYRTVSNILRRTGSEMVLFLLFLCGPTDPIDLSSIWGNDVRTLSFEAWCAQKPTVKSNLSLEFALFPGWRRRTWFGGFFWSQDLIWFIDFQICLLLLA